MKYIPLGDKIIVRPLTDSESSNATASGIFVPDSSRKDNEAIVVVVGEGVYDPRLENYISSDVKVGDLIVHASLGTWKEHIKHDNQDCYIIKESDILAYAARH